MKKYVYTSLFAAALLVGFVEITEQFAKGQKSTEKADEKPAKEDGKADVKMPELPTDSLYKLKVNDLDGKEVDLKIYQGKVTLVVNVASRCGYTPQYEGLQKLYTNLKDKGFLVLGFPSNDFGKQEPGTAEEIREFCTDNYEVTFPLFEKLQTKEGEGQSPVYANLKKQSDSLPGWNFCKYLVGKDGKVIKFYNSKTKPDDEGLRKEIDAALAVEYTAEEKRPDADSRPDGDNPNPPDKEEKK